MLVHEAETCFRRMLRLAGVDDGAPDLVRTWQVFQDFCRLPISEPTVLLFTCDPDNQSAPPRFCLSFERQMSVCRASSYSHMEHLTCTLSYPLVPGTPPLEDEEIVFELGSDGTLEDFIAEVEATNPFKALTEQSQPTMLTITQGKV